MTQVTDPSIDDTSMDQVTDIPEEPPFQKGVGFIQGDKPILQWFTSQSGYDAAVSQFEAEGTIWTDVDENTALAWVKSNSSLSDAQEAKMAEILSGANTILNSMNKKYSEVETLLFTLQEKGARDILAGDTTTSEAVRVASLAEANGVTAEEFANRIVANADAASDKKWTTVDEQQAMEAAVKNAATAAEVWAVEVKYTYTPSDTTSETTAS